MLGRVVASVALFAAIGLAPSLASAQSPPAAPDKIAVGDWLLSPLFELRTRGEYRRDAPDLGGFDDFGRLTPRVRDAWVVLNRARLGLGVERGPVAGQITLQDARALGSPSPTGTLAVSRGISKFEPYEAYLMMRSSSARPTYLKLGRQAVVWGEGRLVGNADFGPAGRSLDAVRGHFAVGNFDFEGLAVLLELPGPLGTPVDDRRGPARSGIQLYGLTAKWSIDPLLKLELFGLARIARGSGENLDGSRFALSRLAGEQITTALRVSGEAKGWTYGVEGAYQFGTVKSIGPGGSRIAAYAASAHVSKTLNDVALTPTIRLAGSHASGDGDDTDDTYNQFDPILADPQRFHGQMDLLAWSNMVDMSARATIVPWTDTTFGIEYRYAALSRAKGDWVGSYLTTIGRAAPPPGYAQAGYAPVTGTSSSELGHEIDAVFTWRPWVPLELKVGWSGMFLGDGARAIMAQYARGRAEADASITSAKLAQYAFGQATLTMP
ncbi:MAG: alginate export family protein [Deltaproteobacteria bacterium]|nr:alginate export family protein [Deltaproteobacteria bacterium]